MTLSEYTHSIFAESVYVAGNQGQNTKEGLIMAAVGRLHHIPSSQQLS